MKTHIDILTVAGDVHTRPLEEIRLLKSSEKKSWVGDDRPEITYHFMSDFGWEEISKEEYTAIRSNLDECS